MLLAIDSSLKSPMECSKLTLDFISGEFSMVLLLQTHTHAKLVYSRPTIVDSLLPPTPPHHTQTPITPAIQECNHYEREREREGEQSLESKYTAKSDSYAQVRLETKRVFFSTALLSFSINRLTYIT